MLACRKRCRQKHMQEEVRMSRMRLRIRGDAGEAEADAPEAHAHLLPTSSSLTVSLVRSNLTASTASSSNRPHCLKLITSGGPAKAITEAISRMLKCRQGRASRSFLAKCDAKPLISDLACQMM